MTYFSSKELRSQFPVITNHPGLAYLDSAASSQKPQYVIDRVKHYYENENANVHRGLYKLSETATNEYERARGLGAKFLGGVRNEEVIFTKGTTEGINLVAQTLSESFLQEGDEIILSVAEHHSNIVPWQIAAQKVGATIKYMTLTDKLRIDLEQAKGLFSRKPKSWLWDMSPTYWVSFIL